MDIILKKCGADDLDALRALSIATFTDTFASTNTPANMEAYMRAAYAPDKLRAELLNPDSDFYFLYADGAPAGYIKLNGCPAQTDVHDPDALEIERLYLHRDFQGLGLGSALMRKALDVARTRRKKYVWLGVWEGNKKARVFYHKHGFYPFGSHPFVMGDDRQTDLLMRKDL